MPTLKTPMASQRELGELPAQARLAFAPLHKRALGTATGLAVGLGIFVLTIAEVLKGDTASSSLILLHEYFAGYSVSVGGAFIGLFWGIAIGFVMGWFFAFCRNLVLATSIFWIRTRAELRANRDFLDHI